MIVQHGMRGTPDSQAAIYHTFNVEDMIQTDHPLRAIKRMVDAALSSMSWTFKAAYSDRGRPGIPPETLRKALLLQCLYTIRSEMAARIDLPAELSNPVFSSKARLDFGQRHERLS